MSKMDTVVDTEPRGQDDVDTRDDVNGHVPEVESAHHVHQGEHHAGHHHQTQVDIAQHDKGHKPHCSKGQPKVPPELLRDNRVRLPGLVNLQNISQKLNGGLNNHNLVQSGTVCSSL